MGTPGTAPAAVHGGLQQGKCECGCSRNQMAAVPHGAGPMSATATDATHVPAYTTTAIQELLLLLGGCGFLLGWGRRCAGAALPGVAINRVAFTVGVFSPCGGRAALANTSYL